MKIGSAIGCLSICLVALVPLGAQDSRKNLPEMPYQALTILEDTPVYSGPAAVHYSTDELSQGSVVEVHRHDPGGWCAIRPPAGSFSLVPASTVTKIHEHLGRINEEGLKAWVGTRLGAVDKPLWQVKLKLDEEVTILGEVSWPDPAGHSTIWYQIAPPSGEFRWVQLANIQPPKHSSDLPDKDLAAVRNIGAGFTQDSSHVLPASLQVEDPSFVDEVVLVEQGSGNAASQPQKLIPPSYTDSTVNQGWRRAKLPVRVADSRSATTSTEPFKIPAISAPAKAEPTRTASITGGSSTTNAPIDLSPSTLGGSAASEPLNIAPISGPVTERIRVLESSLTAEMLKSPDDWELESILRLSTSLASSSNNVTEKQHAQRLVTKIRKCVGIQTQFETAYSGTAANNSGSTSRNQIGAAADSDFQFGSTYDAHGWLNQLVRGKGSLQPTYVLEDDDGRILYHIAPAPGLNLNRYLKNKVGIIGRRGFHRGLDLDHVTAERIVVIDSLRR